MQEHYDIDQTVVPDAFLALYVVRGRPTLDRAALQARYELAETLAAHVAAMCPALAPDDLGGQKRVLDRVHAGLVADPVQVTPGEAGWIVGRVGELLDYDASAVAAAAGPGPEPLH